MRKFLRILALMAAVVLLPVSSLAQITVTSSEEVGRGVTLLTATGNLMLATESGYVLCDENANIISDYYGAMKAQNSGVNGLGSYFLAVNENGLNTTGILDRNAQVLVPLMYGDVEWINADWQYGVVLEETTDISGDYRNSEGTQFNVVTADYYYRGQKAYSFSREEFMRHDTHTARGAYLCIRYMDDNGVWLSSKGEVLTPDVEKYGFFTSQEYYEEYKGPVYHVPTGMEAFTASCTLTPEEVQASVFYKSNGQFVDLQGNLVSDQVPDEKRYDSARAHNGYFYVSKDRKRGLTDYQGNEILPPVYDAISAYDESYFFDGYNAVIRDGELSYVDLQGNTVQTLTGVTVNESDCKGFYYAANFIVIKSMGGYSIFTPTKGLLPETYQDFSTPYPGMELMSVKQGDVWGVIDVDGNVVIPFEHRYYLDLSSTQNIAIGQNQDREYIMYHLADTDAAPAEVPAETPAEEPAETPAETPAEVPAEEPAETPAEEPAQPDAWDCTCGNTGNTGKFCPECGAGRPEKPAACTNCGYTPGEGETPKFCPECGTKF
ncbi:MAG: zinc ribbon domain-containing protein [Clostridiales bacterium]|nr:zinc ribbon domain-containing protein [Clostridiales bacterium]